MRNFSVASKGSSSIKQPIMMNRFHAATISASFLILLYTYTAVSKLKDNSTYERILNKSPLLEKGADVIAWLLPVTELVIVLLLVFPRARKAGFYSSLFLLVLFTLYLIYMLLFAADLPCSCGGVLSKMSWKQHIWFNMFFIGVSIVGIISIKNDKVLM